MGNIYKGSVIACAGACEGLLVLCCELLRLEIRFLFASTCMLHGPMRAVLCSLAGLTVALAGVVGSIEGGRNACDEVRALTAICSMKVFGG